MLNFVSCSLDQQNVHKTWEKGENETVCYLTGFRMSGFGQVCGSLGSSSVLFMLFVSLLFAAQLREVANRIPDSRLTPATQDNMHKS